MITLPQKVTADKVQICLTTGYRRLIAVSEVYFYHYDGLMDEVMGLYVDDLHTEMTLHRKTLTLSVKKLMNLTNLVK